MTMIESDTIMNCPIHGRQRVSAVCAHFFGAPDKPSLGFIEVRSTEPDDITVFNAWCFKCDENLIASGGEWNDDTEAFTKPRLLCFGCYLELKSKHTLLP